MPRRADPFVAHCQDLLSGLGETAARGMFGGWGLYLDGRIFALVIDDRLYLKTDPETRPRFESAGAAPFAYTTKDGRHTVMSYWTAPDEAMESPDDLLPWARLAVEASRRAGAGKPAGRRKTGSGP